MKIEFPKEMLNKTVREIEQLAKRKGPQKEVAKKAWKLLRDKRFRK